MADQQVILDLEAGVTETEGADASAELFITNVVAALNAALASATPVPRVQAVIDRLKATNTALAAAIAANPLP